MQLMGSPPLASLSTAGRVRIRPYRVGWARGRAGGTCDRVGQAAVLVESLRLLLGLLLLQAVRVPEVGKNKARRAAATSIGRLAERRARQRPSTLKADTRSFCVANGESGGSSLDDGTVGLGDEGGKWSDGALLHRETRSSWLCCFLFVVRSRPCQIPGVYPDYTVVDVVRREIDVFNA